MRKVVVLFTAILLLLVSTVMWSTTGYAAVQDDMIQPMYLLTRATKVTLTISDSGVAQCSGYIRATNPTDSVNITITLYKKVGSSWVEVDRWSMNDQLYYASVNGNASISYGKYKLQLSGKVVSSDGTVEQVSSTSSEKTYE